MSPETETDTAANCVPPAADYIGPDVHVPPAAPPGPAPLPDGVAARVEAGRKSLEADRRLKAAEERAEADQMREAFERQFAPLRRAFWAAVPEDWRSEWVDFCEGGFRITHRPTHHLVMVCIPGLAPIKVALHVREWADRPECRIGDWELDPRDTYRVAQYEIRTSNHGVHAVVTSTVNGCDLDQALALARESAEAKARLDAKAADLRAYGERVAKVQAEREAAKPPFQTAEERLVCAVKDIVQAFLPDGQ